LSQATLTLDKPNKIKQQLNYYLPAISIFVGVLLVWELAVINFGIQEFLLPRPSAIAQAFVARFDELMAAASFTLQGAVGGFIIGCTAGLLTALATARWVTVREALLPLAIAANSVPIIAFAPIMNNWFGITSPVPKMMIVAIITYFPMMINSVRGLTAVPIPKLELMTAYAATDVEILYKVRLPNALPYTFNAFKICSTLSLIGAVVGEFFGGPRASLGVFITQEAALFRFADAWAAIVIACALGIGFYLLILLAERIMIPWHASVRGRE